jgi:hypothetical protein
MNKSVVAGLGCLVAVLAATSIARADCTEVKVGTDKAPRFSPPLGEKVIGAGRLQFYSAPDLHCRMKGVFIIPNDSVIAYGQTDDGWTSVMYMKGNYDQGWVRSSRLKVTGTMGPSYDHE